MPEAKLIPAKGRTVPLEDGASWPTDAKGQPVAATLELSRYYRRRVKDQDLVLVDEDAPADPPEGKGDDETKTKGGRSGARKES